MKYLLSQKEFNEFKSIEHANAAMHAKNALLFDALQVIQGITKDTNNQLVQRKVEFFVNNLLVAFTNCRPGDYTPVELLIQTFRALPLNEAPDGMAQKKAESSEESF